MKCDVQLQHVLFAVKAHTRAGICRRKAPVVCTMGPMMPQANTAPSIMELAAVV